MRKDTISLDKGAKGEMDEEKFRSLGQFIGQYYKKSGKVLFRYRFKAWIRKLKRRILRKG